MCRQQVLRGELQQADIESHEEGHAHESENNDESEADRENEIDVVEELESAHQPVMNIDRDYESESKRVRRKPVWAMDYVFSCRMVNTKQTKRKDNSLPMSEETKTRCSWCKGLFEPGTPYEQHMIKCYRNRWTCYSCGCTFKQVVPGETQKDTASGLGQCKQDAEESSGTFEKWSEENQNSNQSCQK